MNNYINANDLKVKGISVVKKIIDQDSEAFVKVRGKTEYVILSLDEFKRFREYEILAAAAQSKRDIDDGKYVIESVDEHIKRIKDV